MSLTISLLRRSLVRESLHWNTVGVMLLQVTVTALAIACSLGRNELKDPHKERPYWRQAPKDDDKPHFCPSPDDKRRNAVYDM